MATRWGLALAIVLGLSAGQGCGDEGDPPLCSALTAAATTEGLSLDAGCGSALLLPSASVAGRWVGGGRDGECRAEGESVVCPLEGGEVAARLVDGLVQVELTASTPLEVGGLALEGEGSLPGATGWLSNGYQSWSQSGVIALGARPDDEATAQALATVGDAEATRQGAELSNWYSLAGGGEAALLVGATTASRLRPWVQLWRVGADGLGLRLASGGAGERVTLSAGERLGGEAFLLSFGEDPRSLGQGYAARLETRRAERLEPPALGWNSWYELWDGVDEEAVRENARLLEEALGPLAREQGLPLTVVIDDGWQQAWGDWEPNEKFPDGIDGLVAELGAQGFTTGLWLAPLLARSDSEVATAHPEWFIPGLTYPHLADGEMLILDVTDPGAAAHLAELISRLVGWGLDLLKIDFLFAGAYEAERQLDVTGTEAYRLALSIIREAAGDDTVLLAVGAPPLPSFPYVDAWRLGADIALEPIGPSWYFMLNQGRSLASRWLLCEVTLCDADPPLLRQLPDEEVRTGAWVVALAGGGIFLSDDLRELDQGRLALLDEDELLRAALSGAPSTPLDLFPPEPPATLTSHLFDTVTDRNNHVLPASFLTPDGAEVRFNYTDQPQEVGSVIIPPRGVRLVD